MAKREEMVFDGLVSVLTGDVGDEGPRTKMSHPYSYDPFTVWRGDGAATNGVYTDRLLQWGFDKHNALCQKHFGERSQYWADREPEKIQDFLRDYLGDPALVLVEVVEHCNQATGFPLWYLAFRSAAPAGSAS